MQVTLFKFTVLIYISKSRYKSYNVTFENLSIKKTWVKIKKFSSFLKPNFGDNIKATL